MKVYTKTGDKGTTSLIGGERVSKADPRVEAYGTVDELAAHIALLADMMRSRGGFDTIVADIDDIQRDLMTVEALLASGSDGKVAPLPVGAIARLESQIDEMSVGLPPVKGFTIPGGHPVVSQSHVCRTVCRRAERAVVRMGGGSEYLNRLSDWLYVVGRKAVEILGVKEKYWIV
ncbi:MAG: cob(I)yrinic acid a,c-diamide adenosyltransferase [Alistipes sp.]|jgi:cob(I)alamin adenosyltransferase|nr:cob(I)yrinic acid a,c-diamide adenosyltransferase [Alistipes sp.]